MIILKKLSIIIVTFNSEKLIFECLDSIYRFNDIGDELEVIIVDNDSTNQKKLFISICKRYSKEIVLLKNPINNGYGGGNNLGVQHSTAKYFIVMNPDVRIIKPIYSKLINRFENNQFIGMLGVTFADGSFPFYFKPEYVTVFRSFYFKIYAKLKIYNMNCMYLQGSFLMFNKNTFIEVGGFDENIFLYYEESDISNRILNIGKQLVLAKDSEVYHLVHNRNFNKKLAVIDISSMEYYLNKYHFLPKKTFKSILYTYKIKLFVANLISDSKKKLFFKEWINLLEDKIKNINI